VINMPICENAIDTYKIPLMRPDMRIMAEVTEEEEDLKGPVQDESGTTCQLRGRIATD
jgi:hypothetical protein